MNTLDLRNRDQVLVDDLCDFARSDVDEVLISQSQAEYFYGQLKSRPGNFTIGHGKSTVRVTVA